jgi:hypothetical protein
LRRGFGGEFLKEKCAEKGGRLFLKTDKNTF